MLERHQIYLRRSSGLPWPWTADETLRTYAFTNVYRELDRVTVWLREHWREPYADHPNLWYAMCLARQINWPPTLEALGFPEEWGPEAEERAIALMNERTRAGEKVYTGAYMIHAAPEPGRDKHRYIIHDVCGSLWRENLERPVWAGRGSFRTLAEAWAWLRPHESWGPFMAYEAVTDLRWTRYLRDAPDVMTWANAGPGALRGLNYLYGRPMVKSTTDETSWRGPRFPKPEQALAEMVAILAALEPEWPAGWPALELRDVEMSLCEYYKYEKARRGEGRPRARYKPPAGAGIQGRLL